MKKQRANVNDLDNVCLDCDEFLHPNFTKCANCVVTKLKIEWYVYFSKKTVDKS